MKAGLFVGALGLTLLLATPSSVEDLRLRGRQERGPAAPMGGYAVQIGASPDAAVGRERWETLRAATPRSSRP